jgi:hypothetical protein
MRPITLALIGPTRAAGLLRLAEYRQRSSTVGGDRSIFCASTQAGALVPLSEKEGRKRLLQFKKQDHVPSKQRN